MRERFSVPEVSCDHCKATIEGALGPAAGVVEATVDVHAKQVEVEWDAGSTSRAEVIEAIRESGYEVGP